MCWANVRLVLLFLLNQRGVDALSSRLEESSKTSSEWRPGRPILDDGWPLKFPAKEHCSKCGLCETSFVSQVKEACALLLPETGMSRMHALEEQVHGRSRDYLSSSPENEPDEARFGVMYENMNLVKGVSMQGAQWTGVVTGIAVAMIEANEVDAVVCIANSAEESTTWAQPEPILARTLDDVLKGRGVKPALAPSLKVLDEIQRDPSIQRLLFCGVGCAVQAFRAVQHQLRHVKEVYVLGTNCVDNSPTPKAAEAFVREGLKIDKEVAVHGYEFMPDFRVHTKTANNGYDKRPYFSLPGTIAEPSIAKSCLACFDYTNGLADVVVGYMGAPYRTNQRMDMSEQTVTIRNARGAKMLQTAIDAERIELGDKASGQGRHESQAVATVQADSIVLRMLGKKVPEKGLPLWIGEILATILTTTGPKGVNFARYSIDYHLLRNYLYIVKEFGEDAAEKGLPDYAMKIVRQYRESFSSFEALANQLTDAQQTGE